MYFVLEAMEKSNNIYDENLTDVQKLKTRLIYYLNENEISTKLDIS